MVKIKYTNTYYKDTDGVDYYELFEGKNVICVALRTAVGPKYYDALEVEVTDSEGMLKHRWVGKKKIAKYIRKIPKMQIAIDCLKNHPVAIIIRDIVF